MNQVKKSKRKSIEIADYQVAIDEPTELSRALDSIDGVEVVSIKDNMINIKIDKDLSEFTHSSVKKYTINTVKKLIRQKLEKYNIGITNINIDYYTWHFNDAYYTIFKRTN
jgi:citrate lyase gamma subunit